MLKITMCFNDFKLKCWKHTMLFNDFKLKCWKTQCFSMISSSKIGKHYVVQWFQIQMLKNIMLFNDFELKGWTTQCVSWIQAQMFNHTMFINEFSHNTCCWWVSLTYSPEHTARQCRNFTFPGGAGKQHRVVLVVIVPLYLLHRSTL